MAPVIQLEMSYSEYVVKDKHVTEDKQQQQEEKEEKEERKEEDSRPSSMQIAQQSVQTQQETTVDNGHYAVHDIEWTADISHQAVMDGHEQISMPYLRAERDAAFEAAYRTSASVCKLREQNKHLKITLVVMIALFVTFLVLAIVGWVRLSPSSNSDQSP